MAAQFSVQDNKPWKSRFFMIWGGQAFSILGSQLVQFALIWYLTVKTGSATMLATATLVSLLPNVILGPFVGTLVDRMNRRWIMVIADSFIALATIGLAILFALDMVTEWHIYLVMFIRSLAGCFHGNSMNASTSLMVPVENLTRIQGINNMLTGGLNVISAPLGALLLNILPIQGILAIDIVTAMLAVLPLCFIPIPQPERVVRGKTQHDIHPTVWQDFKTGFRFILGWPGLLILSLMTIVINFTITPAFSLLPLLVKNYFGGNAIHLSWIESALGIGVMVGGGLLGIWGGFKRKIITSLIGIFGIGVGSFFLAFTPSSLIAFAVAGTLLVGLMMPIAHGPFYAMLQTAVEPDMQARIFSLISSVAMAMSPIGLMFAGPIADRFGIQVWFMLCGSVCVLMSAVGFIIPAVMNIEKPHDQFNNFQINTFQ